MSTTSPAKIEAFLDCEAGGEIGETVSPYSYYALLYLLKNRPALESHGVEIEFTPVFLGGINVGSGNTPPWKNPAKAKYGTYDGARAKKYFGKEGVKVPDFFPILSLLPQRAMTFAKSTYPTAKYETAFESLWKAMWEEGLDVSNPSVLADVLGRTFAPDDVRRIMEGASDADVKKRLLAETQRALERGAFGAPWFWVTNGKGVEEPFFGSDRFHYMWEFLGLPWSDVELKPKL